jgi:competence ComEA-like helix-hairpin-helix protein
VDASEGFSTVPKPSWPKRNRQITLWAALAILTASCVYRYWQHRRFVGGELVLEMGDSALESSDAEPLTGKINPNTSDWASMTRLPGIGPTRARAIVAYREQYLQDHPDETRAFTCAEDLMRIKGIGEKISAQIEPFLSFEENVEMSPVEN